MCVQKECKKVCKLMYFFLKGCVKTKLFSTYKRMREKKKKTHKNFKRIQFLIEGKKLEEGETSIRSHSFPLFPFSIIPLLNIFILLL